MQYNYVIYDSRDDYYVTAISDLKKLDNVHIYRYEFDGKPKIFRYLYRTFQRLVPKCRVYTLFQDLFNAALFDIKAFIDRPICFIFSTKYYYFIQGGFINYLRHSYPECKIVFLLRDTVKHQEEAILDFSVNKLKVNSDLIITANRLDAQMYGLDEINSFCSVVEVLDDEHYPISDVVYIGKAKDRLDTIVSAYQTLTGAGLKCDFYITGVSPNEERKTSGIIFAKYPMSYTEMLYRTKNSRCILEATQKGSDGFTSRFFEALCYNKKLITDNERVKETNYYNPNDIYVYSFPGNISPEFIKGIGSHVDYGYNGEYSPIKVLEQIEKLLEAKNEAS